MARTVAGRRVPDTVLGPRSSTPYPDKTKACTFCTDRTPEGVRHDFCPGESHTSPGKKDDRVWTCQCWKEGHPQ